MPADAHLPGFRQAALALARVTLQEWPAVCCGAFVHVQGVSLALPRAEQLERRRCSHGHAIAGAWLHAGRRAPGCHAADLPRDYLLTRCLVTGGNLHHVVQPERSLLQCTKLRPVAEHMRGCERGRPPPPAARRRGGHGAGAARCSSAPPGLPGPAARPPRVLFWRARAAGSRASCHSSNAQSGRPPRVRASTCTRG